MAKRNLENPKDRAAYLEGRIDLAIIPPVALAHMAMALMDGDEKYEAFNFRHDKIQLMGYASATKRHIDRWIDRAYDGDIDPRTLVHELGAALASLAIMLDAIENGNAIDNRPPKGNVAEVFERLQKQVQERRRQRENAKAETTKNAVLRSIGACKPMPVSED